MKMIFVSAVAVSTAATLVVNGSTFERSSFDLAPETNKNHRLRHRRDGGILRFSIVFEDKLSKEATEDFQYNFNEFVVKNYNEFNFAHLEIPEAIAEDVVNVMKLKTYISAIDHEVTHTPHGLYWNKDRIGVVERQEMKSGNRDFVGNGFGTYIYVVDSGIDDHVEFGNRIDRTASKGFDGRTDTFDCLGHAVMWTASTENGILDCLEEDTYTHSASDQALLGCQKITLASNATGFNFYNEATSDPYCSIQKCSSGVAYVPSASGTVYQFSVSD
eukprot:Awhi_evm1s15836